MNPRPLYRWKSLWLGLFVLVFLGWAWVRSVNRFEQFLLSAGPGRSSVALVQDSAVLRLWWGKDGTTHYRTFNSYGRHIELSERKWVRETVDFGEWIPGCLTLSVGYCFLCSWCVLGWIFLLLRKWKRERVPYDPRPS